MNYGELKTLVEAYLHRNDLTSYLDTFLSLAQTRVFRDVKAPEFETRATMDLIAGDRYIPTPSDMKTLLNVQIDTETGRKVLLPLSRVQMDSRFATVTTDTPYNYAIYGDQIELQPTPGEDLTIEIIYQYRPALMTENTDENDLLTRNPNIFIYAAMLEATPFIQGDERVGMWREYYEAELVQLNTEADDRELSGGPLQIMKLGVSTP